MLGRKRLQIFSIIDQNNAKPKTGKYLQENIGRKICDWFRQIS